MLETKTILCELCGNSDFRYKCPTCYVKYCSLVCYKTHKQTPCEKPKQPDASQSLNLSYQFPTPDTVAQERLKELTGSDEIRECLRNPHVRKIMLSLVSSPNPDKAIEEAMKEPIFAELAVASLKVVEPHTFVSQ